MLEKLIETAKEKYNGRKIVVWGFGKNAEELESLIKKEQLGIDHYIDSDMEKVDGKTVLPTRCIDGRACDIYVIVSITNEFDEIFNALQKMGFKEGTDFVYYPIHEKYDVINPRQNYTDKYGNRIILDSGAVVKITFTGCNSSIHLGKGFEGNGLALTVGSFCNISIGDHVKANTASWVFENNADCVIEDYVKFNGYGGDIALKKNGRLHIGKETLWSRGYCLVTPGNTFIKIGEKCLFGKDIVIRSGDSHAIFDTKSGVRLNDTTKKLKSCGVTIGNHVWGGERVIVLYDTNISDGCVIGAGALVKGSFPNNCILAGVPAKVIRENIAWCLDDSAEDIAECGEYARLTGGSVE